VPVIPSAYGKRSDEMDLEASLDRMCMGVEELNFRLARIEIALRKQNLRIRLSEAVIVIKDVSSAHGGPEDRD
jgi:hypothetical protein